MPWTTFPFRSGTEASLTRAARGGKRFRPEALLLLAADLRELLFDRLE